MSTPATSHYLLKRVVLGILGASLCALPARAQFVSTAITNSLSQPAGVVVNSTNYNVYITDPGNFRVAEFIPSAGELFTLAGSGTAGTNAGLGLAASFSNPQGIVAARGGLIVVDENSQLIRYVSYGGAVSNLAGLAYTYGMANGPAATATFSYPVGIAADNAGDLFVADSQNRAIREIDTNNIVSTVATGGFEFNLPVAVAVDNNSNIWVADAGASTICMISNGAVTVVAGVTGQQGTNDSLVGTSAHFRSPSGLLWVPAGTNLLIADTGNDTVRSLFLTNYNGAPSYAVQTIAGLPHLPGFVDGALSSAQFDAPVGLSVDPTDIGFYVADGANNSLRVLQPTAPLPPVATPVFGYVTFPANAAPPYSSVFVASSAAVFNNLTNIAIKADQGTVTYITYGPTGSAIPQPGPGSETAPTYPGDGNIISAISSAISPGPGTNDITIYAISVQSGRRSSPVVSARFQFITANPVIIGNNAADVLLTDITLGANMYYTIDGSSPTNDGSSTGPVSSGTTLSLDITSNVVLQVRAFTAGLATSQIVSNSLSISNVVGNQLIWGFASGPVSTHFISALNLLFTAPVAFTGIPSSLEIYAMQFDVVVTNNGATPPPAFSFVSDLLQPLQNVPNTYIPINPGMYLNGVTNPGIITTQPDALEIFWLVYPSITNLYSSKELLQFSGAAQTFFDLDVDNVSVPGTVGFVVPAAATPGTPYTIKIEYTSASSYVAPLVAGPPINVLVQAPTNGNTTGTGPNSIKLVTVLTNNAPASAHLVGDVFPFTWYNIGDFGDTVLENDDVIETMENVGIAGFANNPFYDAMDSSDGLINNYYTASDAAISGVSSGDGVINVDDVYVTLRRSLDPSITDYLRTWSGVTWVPSVYPYSVQQSLGKSLATPEPPSKLATSAPRYITVAADQVQAGGNRTVQVPIRVLAGDTLPMRVFMANVVIEALDGSPAITNEISFSPVTNLGAPYANVSQGVNNYAAAWLDSTVAGVSGANLIGTLTVTLPPNVTAQSAYRVHFNHFSASPNGIALFHTTVQDGLITVGNRTGSSWGDGIPDTWRLVYFGTISNILSAANADPDGDGASNWDEYIAGTNPLDATSIFEFLPATPLNGSSFTLQWPSVVNKNYTVQSSSAPGSGWTTIANLIGNGQTMQWTDTNATSSTRFYRAQVQ
ncbi:MAG TPA: chitobiase/beta-hexosaminidase C-terminal domain-containing protein [Verrucomicrobiae bacterium]|jgi:sugar lactone lactonase YvrE|nr:chitobiase/beta-hexosaminidase C-terminal domain-containing protein [Verrucomicrobiae bacterium]